jgi:hypothetical protein
VCHPQYRMGQCTLYSRWCGACLRATRTAWIRSPVHRSSARPVERWMQQRRLLLPRIVGRVDVGDAPRPCPVELHHRFFFGPRKVVGLGLHDDDAAGP